MKTTNRSINADDIKVVSSSWMDKSGTVFTFDNGVYRHIDSRCYEIFNKLKSSLLADLERTGLVATEEADIDIEGLEHIIKHKKIDCISYGQEWTLAMLQEAAVLSCDINLKLLNMGLALKDSHPWNVTFDYSKPVFLDYGSIDYVSKVSPRAWLREFYKQFYIPLWIGTKISRSLAYSAMKEHPTGFGKKAGLTSIIPFLLMPELRKRNENAEKFQKTIISLKDRVSRFSLFDIKREWSDYQPAMWKHKVINDFLSEVNITSCLDMACNRGEFSIPIAERGIPVIATDVDEYSIDFLREQAKEKSLPLTALLIDYLRPTAPFGVGLFYANSYERLKSEMTLSFAIAHHLVFKNGVNFRVLRDVIVQYTGRYALIEFIPLSDKYVAEWIAAEPNKKYDWYSKTNMIREFSSKFSFMKTWDCPYNNREILLFKKL
ncbi:class I SAM-dependent methyltransferase [cf. Phormidesmis sp. LEGE 11477]|uniref:class I SAM-dependent methyltransferase n=1 Tax=cf. Phormidesmis sp. LEGE 11477 TaxID=1828680 RepID=UPI00187EFF9C|nr:class I SAM-dependent methyltransferase [cf. Phormidesmis sp. LEGE 11477]MBE9063611.1 class I SAM-dependent methyltransferase [cf. Phormidesmis sp. LEGE 11477]